MYRLKVIDEREVYEYHLDLGYNTRDALILSQFVVKNDRETADRAAKRLTRDQICAAFDLGVIDEQEAIAQLQKHGLEPQDAQAAILNCQIAARVRAVKETINAVRRRALEGVINLAEARRQLDLVGVKPNKSNELVNLWAIQLSGPRRTILASKIQDLVSRGLVSDVEAANRLVNLGYVLSEANLIVQAGLQDLAKARVRAAMQLVKDQKMQQAEVAKMLRDRERDTAKLRTAVLRRASPAALRRYLRYRPPLISQSEVASRLSVLGYQPDDITRFLADAALQKPLKRESVNGNQTPQE